MKNWLKVILFCLACVVFVGADRLTKQLAKEHLMNAEPKSYFHDSFRFEYVENTGAALSFGDDLPKSVSFWLLSMVPLIVLAIFFGYVMKHLHEFGNFKSLCFALIIAGGLGNVIDRIVYDRHVTDFMNMGIGDLRTGIFNVADVCITVGVIGLAIVYVGRNKGILKPDGIEPKLED